MEVSVSGSPEQMVMAAVQQAYAVERATLMLKKQQDVSEQQAAALASLVKPAEGTGRLIAGYA